MILNDEQLAAEWAVQERVVFPDPMRVNLLDTIADLKRQLAERDAALSRKCYVQPTTNSKEFAEQIYSWIWDSPRDATSQEHLAIIIAARDAYVQEKVAEALVEREVGTESAPQVQTSGPQCKKCGAYTTRKRVESHGLCMKCELAARAASPSGDSGGAE